jgi:hypothetical protein
MVTAMPMLSGLFKLRRSGSPSFEPRIEVRSGLHRGVRIRLSNRSYSIGSGMESDIVLRDRDIASRHALLHLEDWRVRIEACDGNVAVGSKALTKGDACYVRLPAELALGDTNLHVVPAPGARAVESIAQPGNPIMKSAVGRSSVMLGVVSLSVLALPLMSDTFPASTKSSTGPLVAGRASDGCGDVAPQRSGSPSPVHLIQDMVQFARKRLYIASVPGPRVECNDGKIFDAGAPNRADVKAKSRQRPGGIGKPGKARGD